MPCASIAFATCNNFVNESIEIIKKISTLINEFFVYKKTNKTKIKFL